MINDGRANLKGKTGATFARLPAYRLAVSARTGLPVWQPPVRAAGF
jgi:hypothetical protein